MASNATNMRIRHMLPSYYFNWMAPTDFNNAADEIIETPEKHLLSQSDLFQAEGGAAGHAV